MMQEGINSTYLKANSDEWDDGADRWYEQGA